MRLSFLAAPVLLALASCGPPRAAQFVGADGSRDWWTVHCGGNEPACWAQASAACRDSFDVHEVRAPGGAGKAVQISVRGGKAPEGTPIAHRDVVLTCTGPTVPPRYAAGAECRSSPPRLNHCDLADGEAFTTGRTYLPPDATSADAKVAVKGGDDALTALRALAEEVAPEVALLAKPVDDVPALVKTLGELPRAYRMKPARLKALAKRALAGGDTTAPKDVREEARDDVSALLASLKDTAAALATVADRVPSVRAKLAAQIGKVAPRAHEATVALRAEVDNPVATAAEKAKASSELDALPALRGGVLRKLTDLQTKTDALPDAASAALAKLTGATS